jgi:hypothetical protein
MSVENALQGFVGREAREYWPHMTIYNFYPPKKGTTPTPLPQSLVDQIENMDISGGPFRVNGFEFVQTAQEEPILLKSFIEKTPAPLPSVPTEESKAPPPPPPPPPARKQGPTVSPSSPTVPTDEPTVSPSSPTVPTDEPTVSPSSPTVPTDEPTVSSPPSPSVPSEEPAVASAREKISDPCEALLKHWEEHQAIYSSALQSKATSKSGKTWLAHLEKTVAAAKKICRRGLTKNPRSQVLR